MAGADSTAFDFLDVARFWSKVQVGNRTDCWGWTGALSSFGHGSLKWAGQPDSPHRIAYLLAHGEPPAGAVIRHTCDNPACCNPFHLRTGTHADNVRDRVLRRRGAVGERSGRAKLTEFQVRQIAADWGSAERIARQYGVSKATVDGIRARRTWKHLWSG